MKSQVLIRQGHCRSVLTHRLLKDVQSVGKILAHTYGGRRSHYLISGLYRMQNRPLEQPANFAKIAIDFGSLENSVLIRWYLRRGHGSDDTYVGTKLISITNLRQIIKCLKRFQFKK